MSTITFGSVGDIISICLLVKDILATAHESWGSDAEYRALSDELRCLERALLETALLIERHRGRIGLLANVIGEEVVGCRSCLERIRALLTKYKRALGPDKSSAAGPATRFSRRVQWRLAEKDTIAKFRQEILSRCNTLGMLLATANVYVKSTYSTLPCLYLGNQRAW
jgi:hypothetical protein